MKERSLVERIVAILGVLLGTIAWVVRLLFSVVKGLLSGGSGTKQDEAGAGQARVGDTAKTYATDLRHKGETLIGEAREKGGALLEDVKEKGEDLIEDTREKVDEVMHRGEREDGDREGASQFTAAGSSAGDRSDISSTQHDDVGGVPEEGAVAAASLSAMDAAYDEQSSASMDDDEETQVGTHVTEGIPNLEEPGEGDESEMYGSESGSLMGRDDETGYAGQAMSESDIGVDRGDSISGFADAEDREGGEFRGWISDEVNVVEEESTGEEYDTEWVEDQIDAVEVEDKTQYDTAWVTDQINAEDEETDEDEDEEVPAASRGWEEPEDDVLKNDPLYGDFESSGTGGEVDLRNDEAEEEDAAGMHIIDSPDEPFIEDEEASESLGFVSTGMEPPFDATEDDVDVDEVGDEPVALGEDQLAADALGHPAGHDAASGDLGPEESPDDATWEPGASRPDYDVLGAYDGSGVDEFADDAVAGSMLEDVTGDEGETPAGSTGEDAGEGSGTGTGSVAWATSSGVIDRDLAKPLSTDELQADDTSAGSEGEGMEAGDVEADAGLKDVAAEVAEDLDREAGDGDVATGTTMSGAGQSAGAMTSEDATSAEEGGDGTLSDAGSVETGGEPATDGGEETGTTDASAGRSGGATFDEVLPESEYASSVGYDTLQADEGSTGTDAFRGSFLTETSTSGVTPATSGTSPKSAKGKQGKVPEGAVRGDGSGTCPAGYPIKGNASSRIYHRPTDSSYESTIPEFCFATEDAARAAGFRARKS